MFAHKIHHLALARLIGGASAVGELLLPGFGEIRTRRLQQPCSGLGLVLVQTYFQDARQPDAPGVIGDRHVCQPLWNRREERCSFCYGLSMFQMFVVISKTRI